MVSSRVHEPQRVSGDKAAVGRYPDGIVVDVAAGHIYWTNMGDPAANDGSIERADFDGQNRKTVVPDGGTLPRPII
jgi:DNA-binding beta-propeller fold protein YncE